MLANLVSGTMGHSENGIYSLCATRIGFVLKDEIERHDMILAYKRQEYLPREVDSI
jgi:hypothetical protein